MDDLDLLDAYSRAVIAVVGRVSPAVASLSVTGSPGGRRPQGSGSGLVFASDGYVLTNNHVVENADAIEIRLQETAPLVAQLVGTDPATDLAVLRVNAGGLPHATLGDGGPLRVGQVVLAFGNPLGFDATVSNGIVSSLTRSMRARDGRLIENVIQHTAPLNPGNSGGPLVDTRGEVVGINTAIIAGSQGIGFAVPATTALWVVPELLAHGRVRRGFLGIAGRDRPLPRLLVRFHELTLDRALEVMTVEEGSPAAAAGVRRGDLVVAVDGAAIDGVDGLHRRLTRWEPGRRATLTVIRWKQKLAIDITPATR
jgi:S1-C subfamily serine protease